MRKSVLGVFMGLIQHPKLTSINEFNQIKKDSKFIFLKEIRDLYIENPESSPSIIFEKIKGEKIKNIFGEALVSEIKLSIEDAESMIGDCLKLILQSDSEREQFLIEKFNMQELSSAEKRELQQIILKKAKMSQDEEALIKKLSLI
jgi:DNA primase